MSEHGSTTQQTDGRIGTIDPAVGQLIRRLIANDERLGSAPEADEIILDIEVDGIRYLAIRCRPRSLPDFYARPNRAPPGPVTSLSPREAEIARMVAKGYANKTIASVLDISSWTVSSHLRRIFTKFGVTSRAAMVARLLDDGRTSEPPPPRWQSHQTISQPSTRLPSAYGAGSDLPDLANSFE